MLPWLLIGLPFLFLWGVLINQLRVEWSVNPQYSYGWLVPFLCLSMLVSRWQTSRELRNANAVVNYNSSEGIARFAGLCALALISTLAFLYLPTRLIQEANPEWRMISWLLALEVIGLSLAALWLRGGREWVVPFAFPLCFFLVAVPWPTIVEGPLIQLLTSVCASLSVEIDGWRGIPAIQHGNLIEVSTGTVGVDEACSGIRSFQSTLMISLYLGEFYGMTLWRRVFLVPAGFLLALVFNIIRITFLTSVAARQGVGAISKYHDPAGITIMVACVFSLWLLALLFRGRSHSQPTPAVKVSKEFRPPTVALKRLAFSLFLWLAAVEVGVDSWYRVHEARLPKSAVWSMEWPRDNPTFAQLALGEKTTRLLRYDEGNSVAWQENDGTRWQMFYFRWLPGRIAVQLATSHTPEVCLAAAGHTFEIRPDLAYLPVHGLKLPFREYSLNEDGDPAYVFYCLWEDRAEDQTFETKMLTYGNRLGPVLAGRRNVGQRSLEITVRGYHSLSEAQDGVTAALNKYVRISEADAKSESASRRNGSM
jgi:exosortase